MLGDPSLSLKESSGVVSAVASLNALLSRSLAAIIVTIGKDERLLLALGANDPSTLYAIISDSASFLVPIAPQLVAAAASNDPPDYLWGVIVGFVIIVSFPVGWYVYFSCLQDRCERVSAETTRRSLSHRSAASPLAYVAACFSAIYTRVWWRSMIAMPLTSPPERMPEDAAQTSEIELVLDTDGVSAASDSRAIKSSLAPSAAEAMQQPEKPAGMSSPSRIANRGSALRGSKATRVLRSASSIAGKGGSGGGLSPPPKLSREALLALAGSPRGSPSLNVSFRETISVVGGASVAPPQYANTQTPTKSRSVPLGIDVLRASRPYASDGVPRSPF